MLKATIAFLDDRNAAVDASRREPEDALADSGTPSARHERSNAARVLQLDVAEIKRRLDEAR